MRCESEQICIRGRRPNRHSVPLCPVCEAVGLPVPGEAVGALETVCLACRTRLVVALRPDGEASVRPGELRPSSDRRFA